jgi:hypothetical protein
MDQIGHWLLDFIGVNNGEDSFSTHMYNFWSGFGGNISVLALGGTLIGVYRHNLRRLAKLNPIHRHSQHRDPDAEQSASADLSDTSR